MNQTQPNDAQPERDDALTEADVRRLLSTCVDVERRPVDDLIERLHEHDAAQWLEAALSREGLDATARVELLKGSMALDELAVMKDASKTRTVDAATRDESLAALLCYVLCVAAGHVHYACLLSTQSREVWDDTWVRLADVLEQPWRGLLLDAATK